MNAVARTRRQRPHIRRTVGGAVTVVIPGAKMSGVGRMAGMAAPVAPKPPSIAALLKRIMK